MTKEEILAMEAGQELNSFVLQHIFGFKHYVGEDVPMDHEHLDYQGNQEVWLKDEDEPKFIRFCKACGDLPDYSSDISAAWEVQQNMRNRLFSKRNMFMKHLQDLVSINMPKGTVVAFPDVFWHITPALICKAALLAVIES